MDSGALLVFSTPLEQVVPLRPSTVLLYLTAPPLETLGSREKETMRSQALAVQEKSEEAKVGASVTEAWSKRTGRAA